MAGDTRHRDSQGEHVNSTSSEEVDRDILLVLTDQERPTPVIARLIGQPAPRTYRRCRRLEALGLLESTLVVGRALLYCLDDEEVVTTETYAVCRHHDLRSFDGQVRLWGLTQLGEARVAE